MYTSISARLPARSFDLVILLSFTLRLKASVTLAEVVEVGGHG